MVFKKNNSSSKKRNRRVSFHPDPKVEYFEESSGTVEQNEIEVNLFETQKYSKDAPFPKPSLAVEDDRINIQTTHRKSLDPLLKNIEINEEIVEHKENNKKQEEALGENSIVLKERPKRDTQIDDFMHSLGIRFLDRIITNINRKDSDTFYSAPVNPREFLWLKYSKRPRSEFFRVCIKFMLMQMKQFQEQINAKQSQLDIEAIKTDGLKRLRNESRNKVKLEWYMFRKMQEMNFMSNMHDNENLLISMKSTKGQKRDELKYEIEELRKELNKHEADNTEIKRLIAQNDIPNTEELEDMQYTLMKKSNELEVLNEDKEDLMKRKFEKEMEDRIILDRIKDLKHEIDKLKSMILGKNADDRQLQEMKNQSRRYENIFNCRLVKLRRDLVIFEIFDQKFVCFLNSVHKVIKYLCKPISNNFRHESQIYQSFFSENLLDLNETLDTISQQQITTHTDCLRLKNPKENLFSLSTGNLSEKFMKNSETNIWADINNVLSMPSPDDDKKDINDDKKDMGDEINILPNDQKDMLTMDQKNPENFIKRSLAGNRRFSISNTETLKKIDFLSNTANLENTMDIFMLQKLNENSTENNKKNKSTTHDPTVILKQPLNLRILINKMLFRFSIINNIKKEISLLRENCKIDSFYVKNRIYLRFYLKTFDPSLDIVDLYIDAGFRLFHEKKEICDLTKNLRGLTEFISGMVAV